MITRARQQADGSWILNGSKMWITNGSKAQVAIIWAKTGDSTEDSSIRGFVVPTNTPGFQARDQKGKLSLRARPNVSAPSARSNSCSRSRATEECS